MTNRRSPGSEARATSTTPIADHDDTPHNGTDFDFDRHIVDRVDESIWQALFDGHFRLGVKCGRCGRWLFDGQSKKRGYGAHCARLTGAVVTE